MHVHKVELIEMFCSLFRGNNSGIGATTIYIDEIIEL
jgi:hypothetical protein